MTTQQQTQPKEFNKFQALIWPIHNYELKKFLPMSFLMFCMLFVYTLARDLKDIFIQYHSNMWAGAEKEATTTLLSALKIWYVLPVAFIAVWIFNLLVNKFGSKKTFYIIISFFMIFYALFGFVIYPNLDSLLMSTEQVTAMTEAAPGVFRLFLTCVGNWPLTIFYVLSEIWGAMAISSLFWGFANATTMKSEVKRFFGLFALIANIGTVIAGLVIKSAKDTSVEYVRNFMMAIVVFCLLAMGIYWFINAKVLTDPRFFDADQIKPKKKKEKISALEGMKLLFTNSYLMLIGVLVLGYGIAINFTEVVVKSQMKEAYGAKGYQDMQANISIFTGLFTILVTLVGAGILRKCKWRTTAIITPLMFLICGGLFFGVTIYRKYVSPEIFGMSALILAAWCGVIADALLKSVKYSLFDTTKSMAYIPLDEDIRAKGQAAVEVICGRAGKSGAGFIQQIMFAANPSVMVFLLPITGIFAGTVIAWIGSVFGLSKKYEAKVAEKHEEELA